jgi:hypothetical protein
MQTMTIGRLARQAGVNADTRSLIDARAGRGPLERWRIVAASKGQRR